MVIHQRHRPTAERAPEQSSPDPMKRVTRLNLAELMSRLQQEGLDLPPKPTKGVLIAMLRNSSQKPASPLMTFGSSAAGPTRRRRKATATGP